MADAEGSSALGQGGLDVYLPSQIGGGSVACALGIPTIMHRPSTPSRFLPRPFVCER
jgi:hypothetical protein